MLVPQAVLIVHQTQVQVLAVHQVQAQVILMLVGIQIQELVLEILEEQQLVVAV